MKGQELAILKKEGVVVSGHFVYSSGRHGSDYFRGDILFPNTIMVSNLCTKLMLAFERDGVDVVIGSNIEGAILMQWTAFLLSKNSSREIRGIYASRSSFGSLSIKPYFSQLITEKRVLIVQDILKTVDSVKEIIEATRTIGGEIIGLGAILMREGIASKDLGDIPKVVTLAELPFLSWDEKDCPLCAQGVPINPNIGRGKEFLEQRQLVSVTI